MALFVLQARQRTQHKLAPLLVERLACDIAVLRYGVADLALQAWYAARKLDRNARDELARVADVSARAREEEARGESALRIVLRGYRLRYGRLASAGQAAQPEDAWRVFAIRPVVYLAEEVDAGVMQAGRVVLSLIRVERRVLGGRKRVESGVQI